MKVKTKKYIDGQIKSNIKLLKAELKSLDRATRIYNDTMEAWKISHNEWKSRMEQLTSKTLTRNEAWIFIIAITGFAIMIWLKK